MISKGEEQYVRQAAYLPEHVLPLMTGLSGAEPFIRSDHLLFVAPGSMIFIGYPLTGEFQEEIFNVVLKDARGEFRPASTWLIAPRIPEGLSGEVRGRETDEYYRLDLQGLNIKGRLHREVEKARLNVRVEMEHAWTPEHADLTRDFLAGEELSARMREHYLRMESLLRHSETSALLSARDSKGNLAAYFVAEGWAQKFLTYVTGCYSRRPYTAHASDVLFDEMIRMAGEQGKQHIQLGLGVNEGIRRFKRKWGGAPSLRYESGEISSGAGKFFSWLEMLQKRL